MSKKVIVFAVMLALVAMTGSALAQGFSAGIRIWNATWKLDYPGGGELDLGDEPYLLGYLGYHDAGYSVVGQLGAGSWDASSGESLDRMDLSLAVTTAQGYLNYGAGVRGLLYDVSPGNEELQYVGPELLLGGALPLDAEKRLNVMASGSLGVYFWDYSLNGASADGNVLGYTLDGGLGYSIETVNLRGGFRYQHMEEDSNSTAFIAGHEISGPYIELGLMW
jgi:hypothetical protein